MTASTGARDAQQARQALVVALHEANYGTAAIAEKVKVTKRSVRRILLRAGVTEPQPTGHLDAGVAKRILLYAAEGMPANWIADDLGVRYETALRHAQRAPGHAEAVREWQLVWHQIRKDETLLELHYELSPLWGELQMRKLDAA